MNIKKLFLPVGFSVYCLALQAQECTIMGLVRDASTKEKMPGVNVILDDTTGTATDSAGKYMINLSAGDHTLSFRFIGYNAATKSVSLKSAEARIINIDLIASSTELGTVVVSAGKFEQKIEEVTVSMVVMKPNLVENINATSMDQAMEQVPGVTVIDGQANIRGGSGFSYGAGSRVLLLVDDLPMLAADASDVKWSFLPTENLEQIEVIKGASSALFGSSAMNGIINVRTAYPKSKPETKFSVFGGLYDDPKNKLYKWWGTATQVTQGASISHSQKFGRFDLVVAGNYFKDESYRMGDNEEHGRANINTRYSFGKVFEGLSVGVNANFMHTEGSLFLIWEDDSTGALIPQGGLDTATTTVSDYTTKRFNIDPFIIYSTKNGETHKIRTRFFKTDNKNNTNQQAFAKMYYGEYQFQKKFSDNLTWTVGTADMYNDVVSELYGNHFSNNVALFTQVDNKFNKWAFSFGARWEQNRIDTVKGDFTPVFRSGINYVLFENTHLRTSYGQGYRFPSIAEKYIKTRVGDIIIYPNDSIRPETGFSTEFGINQGFQISGWKGSFDVAGFWSEYKDMMEFTFGMYGKPFIDPLFGFGFKSVNIGNARTRGFDFTLIGEGNFGKIPVSLLAGYTLVYPTFLDFEKINKGLNSDTSNVLKYRHRRTFKADVEANIWHITFGISTRYNSFMENIDAVFNTVIEGVDHFRETHPDGDWVFDARIFYKFLKYYDIGFIVKNIENREYIGRPADLQPPRSFVVQARAKF